MSPWRNLGATPCRAPINGGDRAAGEVLSSRYGRRENGETRKRRDRDQLGARIYPPDLWAV